MPSDKEVEVFDGYHPFGYTGIVVTICLLMILAVIVVVLWYGLTEGMPIFRTFGKMFMFSFLFLLCIRVSCILGDNGILWTGSHCLENMK